MTDQAQWCTFREDRFLDEQFLTLWQILKSQRSGRNQWKPRPTDSHAVDLAINLPLQQGLLTPRINLSSKEIVLSCERGGDSGTETFEMAKVKFFPKERQTKLLVSESIQNDAELMETLRDLSEQPLWYFVANCGTREVCVFCPKPLRHKSSRNVGYGKDCADRRQLYDKYDGPEAKRQNVYDSIGGELE